MKKLVLILFFSTLCTMAIVFINGEKKMVEAVLFSPMVGHITFNGKPASGAKIKLSIAWKDQVGESELFTADENGYFSIPEKKVSYEKNFLVQMSIAQTITVNFNQQDYLIWRAGKSSTHLYGELGGKPKNLTCELTKNEMIPHLKYSLLETLCEWDELIEVKGEE